MSDTKELVLQNQRLYNALAKMFLWQATINDLMLPELSTEVKGLLGEKAELQRPRMTSNTTRSIRPKRTSERVPEPSGCERCGGRCVVEPTHAKGVAKW